MDTRNKIFSIVGSIAVLAAAGGGGYALFATPNSTATQHSSAAVTGSSSVSTTLPSQSITSTASSYKDGTYTASTTYSVPDGGQNSVNATITINSGVITTVSATGDFTDRESARYVNRFNINISSDASNQSIASYSPSRIGGASLTTSAFDSVLDSIRTKARA